MASWWPEVQREGGMTRWSTGDSEGAETILCDSVMVETCHYTFVPNHRRIYTAQNESYGNYEFS